MYAAADARDAPCNAEQLTLPLKVRMDPRQLTTLSDITSCLSLIQSEEATLSSSLSELLTAREPIQISLSRLRSLLSSVDDILLDAFLLFNRVKSTAQTAERIAGRVRSLDELMRRVREAVERVGQVMELKSSLIALQTSIEIQDWESATRHCARAMSFSNEVTSGRFAEAAVPTSEFHLPPAQTLQIAREQLLKVFCEQFVQASKSHDAAATSRYFKLFPAIGWEEEGLEVYASFVVDLVRSRAPTSAKTSSPLYYITAMTALFESIAMIVDQHLSVVEKYYGPGKMGRVINKLMGECDRVIASLVDSWEEERAANHQLANLFTLTPAPSLTKRPPAAQKGSVDEDQVDLREVYKLLSELSGMSGRWALFKIFVSDNLANNPPIPSGSVSEINPDTTQPDGHRQAAYQVEPLQLTASHRIFERLLMTYYVPLELWYTRTSIDKAHHLSHPDLSQTPTVTTTPDDVFYILKIVISRVLTTGSLQTVEKISELLRDIMGREYAGVIKRKLDDVYRNASAPSVGRGEKTERENQLSFIILLNDLDISSSHMNRLIKDLSTSPSVPQFFLPHEHEPVKMLISSLLELVPRYRTNLRAGIEQLFNQLLRPKLRTLINDIYRDVSYVLDDEGYAQAEYHDVVLKRFVKAWEGLVNGYKDTFTDLNYRLFFSLALDLLLRPWEKLVMNLKYTELGAIRFDHELRSVIAYLSSQTVFGDAREKFVRLQQISILLNLDRDEDFNEFYEGSGISWRLSSVEARAIQALRV